MNYGEILDYLFQQLPFYQRMGKAAYKTGLENTFRLDSYFKHPHRQFKTIHVAGTNGKGSVSHMLASILQEAGYSVGLYTSPHLLDFRERMKINGTCISKKQVVSFVEKHRPFFDTIRPSFFEISVFMAFEHFKLMKVDVAVVEVGLGGRLDSTNIILPVLSVITNIGKDHTEFLGKTYASIAKEKAGIIKTNTPVVIGESRSQSRKVFNDIAGKLHSRIVYADRTYQTEIGAVHLDGHQLFRISRGSKVVYPDLACGLHGHYQQKNIVTVLSAIDLLLESGLSVPSGDIQKGIRNVVTNTGLYGRWQSLAEYPAVVCDTAHNAEGIRQVIKQAGEMDCKTLHIVIGFVEDKILDRIFRILPREAEYYFCRLSVPRTMNEHGLMKKALSQGLKGNDYPSVKWAFEAAFGNAGLDDIILITGSTFCVADFLAFYPGDHGTSIKPDQP